jgi:glycosyltransferase involved in cell wall biosynthesis
MKLLFLVRSLHAGGAEGQIVELVNEMARRGHEMHVAVFYKGGVFEKHLEPRVRLHGLGKGGRWDLVGFLHRWLCLLRKVRPDLVHGYLPTQNILAALSRLFVPGIRVVFGVRASFLDFSKYDWLVRLEYYLEARFARFAHKIVANSRSGERWLVARGVPRDLVEVIPNGIDVNRYRPDARGRAAVRAGWGIAASEYLVGMVARTDPIKGHEMLLRAAGLLIPRFPSMRLVFVGDGLAEYASSLTATADSLALSDRLIWAGSREDLPAVYSAFDLAVSCSISEGFPNVVAEAMACGTPCVVTDVGDSALIVGDTGVVVPPSDPGALAEAIFFLAGESKDDRRARAIAARQRVCRLFTARALADRSEALLQSLLA